jgi:hypothetical protein
MLAETVISFTFLPSFIPILLSLSEIAGAEKER